MPVMASHERTSRVALKSPDYHLSEESTRYTSPSPYPPSLSSSDSETDSNVTHSLSENHRLRTSIATIPEQRLREIMVKLVNRSAGFKHAVTRELLLHTTSISLRRKPRKFGHPGGLIPENKCVRCGACVKYGDVKGQAYLPEDRCTFHPGEIVSFYFGSVCISSIIGYLKEEVYEFLSRTPEGRSLNVARTITMWSCCDEDAWTPGCASAFMHQVEPQEESESDV